MRKLLFLLVAIISSGCTCLLSQIPPQKIYAGTGCTAPLPDYRLKITASDNCEISTFTQVPAPGFILSATNKVATVTVKATDASGNFKQVVFTVTLLDTVKPKLTIDPTLLAYQLQQIEDIYNFGDRLIAQGEQNLMKQPWIDSIPGLREKLQDSTYYKKMMLTWTSPGHAVTGYGSRIWTWHNREVDTIYIKK